MGMFRIQPKTPDEKTEETREVVLRAPFIIIGALLVASLILLSLYYVGKADDPRKEYNNVSSACDYGFIVDAPSATYFAYDCYGELSFYNRYKTVGLNGTYCFYNHEEQLLKKCEYGKQ